MKHVLIVDDALEFGRLLQTALAVLGHGMAVAVVPSAEEAMLEAVRYPVDLLVTDFRLPGMTGFELARKIRAQQPKVKVIVVTGMTDARLGQQAQEAGADLFFRKPLEIPQFLEAVTRLLQIETPRAHLTTQSSRSIRPGSPARLEDLLVGLRSHLGAQAALALNDRGQVVVRSGDVPPVLERPEWRELAVGALASAGNLSRRIHPAGGTALQLLRCGEFDLALMPHGENLLVLILRSGPSALRLAISVEELLQLSAESAAPAPQGIQPQRAAADVMPTQPITPEMAPRLAAAAPLPEPDLAEFAAALQKPVTKAKLDADAFWEDTAHSSSVANRPGAISFEEATRLGLTPQQE